MTLRTSRRNGTLLAAANASPDKGKAHPVKLYARTLLDKASENSAVAMHCLSTGQFNAAANRLYYGLYQAMLGCLHHQTGFRAPSSNEHGVVLNEFDRVFVKTTSLLDEATFRKSFELKNKRNTADYKPTHISGPEIAPLAAIIAPAIATIVRYAEAQRGQS